MQRIEPEGPGPSGAGGTSSDQALAAEAAATAADLRLGAVIPPQVQHEQPTTQAIELATTPHKQGAVLPALLTSPTAGDIKEVPAALSRADTGGDLSKPAAVGQASKPSSAKMIFSDLYKSPKSPFNKLRGSLPHQPPLSPDYDPDLVSKDKTKQKEAVRRFLLQKIRNDWEFTWPPVSAQTPPVPPVVSHEPDAKDPNSFPVDETQPEQGRLEIAPIPVSVEVDEPRDTGEEADSESDAESVYSVVSEDRVHFRPRAEWTSDLSDDDEPAASPSPFRFDSPDAVGTVVQATIMAKRRLRRKAVRDEVKWNQGLACYEARRDAWTGSKMVRVKPKPPTPVSPASPRRLFWRSHHRADSNASNPPALASPLSPTTTHTSQRTASPPPSDPDTRSNASSTAKPTNADATGTAESAHLYPVEVLVPVPPPLLPPQNGMRASVTPSIYPSLYDKIVVHSLQPSCPVNLGDMLRACVVGWKRDGEWPPKPTAVMVPPSIVPTYIAVRTHRKTNSSAAAARLEHARKESGAANGAARRMSLGALLGRGSEKEKGGDEQDKERRDSHHDDDAKGLRKSLQKVFSLGHGHSASTAE